MVMRRPGGKPEKIAKKVMRQEGVKISKSKGDKKKISPPIQFLQH